MFSFNSVYPREVIQAALSHDAAALIFAHNHPSGDPKPSSEDVAVTRQLVFAGKVMGMVVHEHLIIGDNRYFSFADQGYITRMNREFEKAADDWANAIQHDSGEKTDAFQKKLDAAKAKSGVN